MFSRHLKVLSSFSRSGARFVTVASRLLQVLSRFSGQARVYGSRFVAFNHGASQRLTVYGPGALQRVAFYKGLTQRVRYGREYIKAGPGRGASFESEQTTTSYTVVHVLNTSSGITSRWIYLQIY